MDFATMNKKLLWIISVLCSIAIFQCATGEKIIVFHHMISYSHRVQTWPLAEELASKGHEVTYISPFYPKDPNPNITELVTKEHKELMANVLGHETDINLKVTKELTNLIDIMFPCSIKLCEAIYTSPEFKEWLRKNPKADLVIIDNILVECGVGLAYKLGAKYLYFSTIPVFPHEYDTIGFLPQSSVIPETETWALQTPMSFLDRISNSIESLKWRWAHYRYAPVIDKLIREELNVKEMPYIDELIRSPSLIFYTGDVVSDYPRSLPPLFVNVAGIHAKKSTKSLPKELEEFIMSGSKNESSSLSDVDDGFIYISLGSMIVSSNLPQHTKDVFFSVIKAFPHIKFLWKWDGEYPVNIPKNLYLSKWFPQIDILGHPKIRGFISQCGRPSLLEALFNGVPMISFPIIGDQEINADRMNSMGAMVKLDIAKVTFEDFHAGVQKVLYDSNMKRRMARLQEIFLDRPMTPIQSALWWTDYVLRNEDTSHLKPAGNDQYWFVRRQIDVWATLSIGIFLILVGVSTILWKIFTEFVMTSRKLKAD